jgi:hypothetical protein
MIVDENIPGTAINENHSFPRNAILELIFKSIENTVIPFVNTVKPHINTFNEDAFTQEFVEKNDFQLSKLTNCIGVKNQYKDLIYKTNGIPDIYYHFKEEEGVRKPIFIIEAKVLPAPSSIRSKEYVIGYYKKSGSASGGIQRFKIEKHGKGQTNCGLIAYVVKDKADTWHKMVNTWIEEIQPRWDTKELLTVEIKDERYCRLTSKVLRKTENELNLYHFWININ